MSWLFSRVLVEEFLEDISLDGEQSAQLSETPTPQAYCSQDKMTDVCRLSRFGMTFAPLMENRGKALLTSYLADFHAKTSALQEKAQELQESVQVCGSKWRELLVKYDLDSHSWRTALSLLNEDLPWSSVTLPKWGITASGVLFQHQIAERPISGTGYGLWLTPSANEDAAGTPNGKMQKMLGNDPRIRGTTKSEWDAGTLNPTWVEWLMGWPLGWTDLKPLETDRFQQWQQQHSEY